MALTITENMRMTAGGKAWRMISVTHDSSTVSLTAGSIDLTYIEAIIGTVPKISMVGGSTLIDICKISITGDHSTLIWASTGVGTQDLTIVGW